MSSRIASCFLAGAIAGSICIPITTPHSAFAEDSSVIVSQESNNQASDSSNTDANNLSDAGVLPLTNPDKETGVYIKDENIYGILSAKGSIESVHVVNQFNVSKTGSITDWGTYNSVENLTNTTSIQSADSQQTFEANEGTYYYEGILSDSALPWTVAIVYMLDGKEIEPENLAGASGHVDIQIKTTKNNAVNPVFYDNYMLQVSFTVPTERCNNINTKDAGIVADAGANKQITYTVMPEKDGNLHFEADVTNFEMSAIQIAGAPFSMSMDDFDTDGMTEGMQELADSVSGINDGVQQLSGGNESLAEGTQDFAKGTSDYTSGEASLSSGMKTLAQSTHSLTQGASGVAQELKGTAQSSANLANETSDVADQAADLNKTLKELDTTGMSESDKKAIEALKADAGELSAHAQDAKADAASSSAAIDSCVEHYSSLQSGWESVSAGLDKTSEGASSLSESGAELANGASQIAQGTSSMASGTRTLANGTAKFADSTADLPTKMQEEIDEAMASYQDDFEPVSFVSNKNNHVEQVQFALTTKAIEIPEEETVTEEEPKLGFLERLAQLFSLN